MLTSNSWRNPSYVDPGLLYQSYYASYDSLTELNDFFLRNYDPALGRWLQTDPYNQFSSPYVGMGNVPHMGVDPDGGFFDFIFGNIVYDLAAFGIGGGVIGALADNEGSAVDGFWKGFAAGLGAYGVAQAWSGGYLGNVFSDIGSGIGDLARGAGNLLTNGLGNDVVTQSITGNVIDRTIIRPSIEVEEVSLLPRGYTPPTPNIPWANDISNFGLSMIGSFEGFEPNIYEDVAGIETIGFGHVVRPGEDFTGGLTRAEGLQLLRNDVQNFVNSVNNLIDVNLTQNQFDALVSFTYNVGPNALRRSTLRRRINAGESAEDLIRDGFTRYNRARINGVLTEVRGLTLRRNREADLYLNRLFR